MDESGDKTLMRRVLMAITVPLVALVTWTVLSSFSNVYELANMESIIAESYRASQDEEANEQSDQESTVQNSAQTQTTWEALPTRTVGVGQEGTITLPSTLGTGSIALTVNNVRIYQNLSEFEASENVDAETFLSSLSEAALLGRTREQIENSPVVVLDANIRNIDAVFSSPDGLASRFDVSVSLTEGQEAQAAGVSLNMSEELTVDIPQGESAIVRLYYSLYDGVDTAALNACFTNGFNPNGMNEVVLFNLGF